MNESWPQARGARAAAATALWLTCARRVLCVCLRSSLPDHDGDSIDMVLMRRFKDCVNAAPVSVAALAPDPVSSAPSTASASATASSSDPASVVDEYTFARLSLTTDISSILHREIRELFALREASIDADDSFTLAYVDQAEQTLLRRLEEWQATHPFWTMRRPSYQQLKEEETRKYKRRQEERAKQAERSRSILGQENAWPDLPKGPAPRPAAPPQSKRSATASPQVGASPAASSPALDAAAATAQPSPLLHAASASSSTAASPSASPPLPSSSSATAATPSASPAPAVSGARSSFFNDDEHGIEDRYHREKAERAKQAAAAAAAASAAATSTETEHSVDVSSSSTAAMVPPKPGRSAQSQAQSQQHSSAPDVYYFYQCSDGQQLYLHGLTYRSLLLQHGGNVSALPARIQGRIAHLDGYVVDRDVRAKHRFLAHLPLTASFGLALVELTSPQLSRATVATMAPEFAADKKARQAAARRQKDLNKRTIQSSKALREAEGGAASSSGSGGSFLPEWQQDAASFPGLAANPLGFASGAPADPSSSVTSSAAPTSGSASALSGGSPQTRVANWNVVAEKGMASSELWAPLQSAPSPVMQSVSHWGSAAAPMAKAGSHPPSLSLGSAGWGRKPAAASSSSSSHPDDADAESFPLPTVNRHGQTTLLSTAGRRSYK